MHAQGSGAYGTFTVTNDITKYSHAKIFSQVGKKTDLFVRFSSVAGERSVADAERDIRGFAIKFYAEAEALVGKDRETHQRDLYDAIEAGNFPKWTVAVQIMPETDAEKVPYHPFDLTKIWPHKDYPLIEVGIMS